MESITKEVLALISQSYTPDYFQEECKKGLESPSRMALTTFMALYATTLEDGVLAMAGLSKLAVQWTAEQRDEVKRLMKYAPYEYVLGHGVTLKSDKRHAGKTAGQFNSDPRQRRAGPQSDSRPPRPPRKEENVRPTAHTPTLPMKPGRLTIISKLCRPGLSYKIAEDYERGVSAPEQMTKATFMALRELQCRVATMPKDENGQIEALFESIDELMKAAPWDYLPKVGVVEKQVADPSTVEPLEVVQQQLEDALTDSDAEFNASVEPVSDIVESTSDMGGDILDASDTNPDDTDNNSVAEHVADTDE